MVGINLKREKRGRRTLESLRGALSFDQFARCHLTQEQWEWEELSELCCHQRCGNREAADGQPILQVG